MGSFGGCKYYRNIPHSICTVIANQRARWCGNPHLKWMFEFFIISRRTDCDQRESLEGATSVSGSQFNSGFSQKNRCPPDSFSPGCAWVALSNPASSLTKKRPRTGAGFITFAFPPTVLRTAFGKAGILPRTKKVSTGHFFPRARARGRPFESHLCTKKAAPPAGVLLFWRREWDSNPRWVAPSPVFKTGSLNPSDISPGTEKPPKRR